VVSAGLAKNLDSPAERGAGMTRAKPLTQFFSGGGDFMSALKQIYGTMPNAL